MLPDPAVGEALIGIIQATSRGALLGGRNRQLAVSPHAANLWSRVVALLGAVGSRDNKANYDVTSGVGYPTFLRLSRQGVLALTLLCAMASAGPVKAAERLLIFAAASLQGTIGDIARRFENKTGAKVTVSLASSSRLARQIQQGAPADIYVSANQEWMDTLDNSKLLRPGTRSDLLGNRLVLVASADRPQPIRIESRFPLANLLGDGRLAMGNPDSVPAGEYGKASLESLGVWETVAGRVAGTSNVRAALALVTRGETPYGVVYLTDALAATNVAVVGVFPADSHPPIVYPVAIPTGSTHPRAGEFLTFLRSPAARKIFVAHGFTVLER